VRETLRQLDRALYQDNHAHWNGGELEKRIIALPKHDRQPEGRSDKNALPGLYS
jgi:hypothetical protein